MGKYANEVVKQAKAWLGLNESDGSHKAIIDLYNSHKPLARGYAVQYDDAWCATFVSAVAIKLGYTDIIPTECSCTKLIELFKKLDSWVEDENRTPNPGDILLYDWDDNGVGDNKGGPEHVGIVEKVSNGKITVIEGNYKNAVTRRTLSVNGKYIRGYGVPKYDVESAKTVDELAQEVIAGKHGSGEARKKSLGDMYDAVQKRVNELCGVTATVDDTYSLEQFIRDVQSACGASVDGKAGSETISKTVTLSAQRNRRHAAVKPVQKRLAALGYTQVGEADGVAGPKFTAAVVAFQEDNHCWADGEITARNKTWKKLLGVL